MPDLELDPQDTHLARALDELAQLVDAPVKKVVRTKSAGSEPDENEVENQIPQPLPEPIPIEVPLPPTPVAIQQPINATLSPGTDLGTNGDRGLLAELAALSTGAPALELPEKTAPVEPAPTHARRRSASPGKVFVAVIAAFVAGVVLDQIVRFGGAVRNAGRSGNASSGQLADNELTGRITYKTKEGEGQADRGARLIVFPQQRSGTVKLSIVGFRPADEPADQQVANAALKALGGAAATVDSEGKYRLPIEAGTYRVLVLSHFQPREESVTDPALNKLLAEYFDKPEELLGRVQFQFSPLRVKGTGDVWDHSF